MQGFPGHKDAVTGLAFREGTQELFSASLDRTVKIWSLAERAYVETLYGHQAGVLAVDLLRQASAPVGVSRRVFIFAGILAGNLLCQKRIDGLASPHSTTRTLLFSMHTAGQVKGCLEVEVMNVSHALCPMSAFGVFMLPKQNVLEPWKAGMRSDGRDMTTRQLCAWMARFGVDLLPGRV